MNFIKRLQKENDDLKAQMIAAQREIEEFRAFLFSSKFVGTEGGERKDWIATTDVASRLADIRSMLYVEGGQS